MTIIAALLLALAAPAAPSAQLTESPRSFVERIYAGYADTGYNTLDYLGDVFAPPLADEIRKDSGTGDEVGYLNGDPICDCQETIGLKSRIERVQSQNEQEADAWVLLDFGPDRRREVTLELVLTARGWRVADVATKEEPSLLEALRRSNAERLGRAP